MVRMRVQDSQFLTAPEGYYLGEVTNTKEIKGKHGPCVMVIFSLNGRDDLMATSLFGKQIRAGGKFDAAIRLLGINTLEIGTDFDTDDLVGCKAIVYVEPSTDANNKTYNNVTKIKRFDAAAAAQLIPGFAQGFPQQAAAVAPAAAPAYVPPAAAPAYVPPAAPAAKPAVPHMQPAPGTVPAAAPVATPVAGAPQDEVTFD